jgi:hypothetical protein
VIATSTLQWVTLAIAGAGLLLGVATFTWQCVSFAWTGARVKVRTAGGVTSYRTDMSATLVTIVEAQNVGRSAVEVTRWGLLLPNDQQFYVTAQIPGNQRTPLTLNGGHSVKWLVPVAMYGDAPQVLTAGNDLKVRGFVDLGTGKRKSDRKGHKIAVSVIRDEIALEQRP